MSSAILLLAVIGLRLWLARVGQLPGDAWAADRFQNPWLLSSPVEAIASFYQGLASPAPAVMIGAIGVVLTIAWRRQLPGAFGGLVIACVAVPVNGLFKLAFGPSQLWVDTGREGTNFPSGHTSFVTAVIGYLGLLCWRRGGSWRILTGLAGLLIVGVGPARVAGGEHLISDVVGGYMVGLALLIVAAVWLQEGGVPGLTFSFRRRRALSRTP
jgi:undecaprenyl-diphosphatase